jgi:Fic family protein
MTTTLQRLLTTLSAKKARLDAHRPLPPEIAHNLDDWFRIELTYSSNAIEGNTLTRQETALVVEKNLTVEGKTVKEHLEATGHAEAYDFVKPLAARNRNQIGASDLLDIHRIILQKIDFANAGRYRTVAVRIAGSTTTLPNATKVPDLMREYFTWLHTAYHAHIALLAAEAHYRLVRIHPFVDGNGRAARLLMNVLLMQAGYPQAIIRPEERRRYIQAIETANSTGNVDDFSVLIAEAINRSLDVYLEALEPPTSVPEIVEPSPADTLLKIGELAEATGERIHTLRFWTKQGLLEVAAQTEGGYFLYSPQMVGRVQAIRRLQDIDRLTLDEIHDRLKSAA